VLLVTARRGHDTPQTSRPTLAPSSYVPLHDLDARRAPGRTRSVLQGVFQSRNSLHPGRSSRRSARRAQGGCAGWAGACAFREAPVGRITLDSRARLGFLVQPTDQQYARGRGRLANARAVSPPRIGPADSGLARRLPEPLGHQRRLHGGARADALVEGEHVGVGREIELHEPGRASTSPARRAPSSTARAASARPRSGPSTRRPLALAVDGEAVAREGGSSTFASADRSRPGAPSAHRLAHESATDSTYPCTLVHGVSSGSSAVSFVPIPPPRLGSCSMMLRSSVKRFDVGATFAIL
jgi:hypothetical protein